MHQGSVLGGALTLAVTTMGAGILTLPSAFSNAGVVPALAMLILVALFTIASIDYMVLCIDTIGVNSYEQINRVLLGKYNEEIVRWMLLIYNTGSAIGYLVVLEDLIEPLQPLISHYIPWLSTTKHTLFVCWFLVVLPLSCVKDISFLQVASVLAISATCLISFLVVFRYFEPIDNSLVNNGVGVAISSSDVVYDDVLWLRGKQPLLALPIMMFSFDCQSLVFQIYSSLDNMNRWNMMKVAMISLIVSGSIHAAVGLFGYLGHPTDVRENVMSNFNPRMDSLFAFGYLVYAIPVNLAFTLMLFPTRDAIFLMWYGYSSATEAANRGYVAHGGMEEYDEYQHGIPLRDHLIVSVSLSVACITAALMAPGIASVVAILGGVCSSTLCFTYPALYRIRLDRAGIVRCETSWERLLMWTMLVFGLVGGVLGTAVALMEYI